MEFKADGTSSFTKEDIPFINELSQALGADGISNRCKPGELDADVTASIVKMASETLWRHREVSYEANLFAISTLNRYYRAIRPHLYER